MILLLQHCLKSQVNNKVLQIILAAPVLLYCFMEENHILTGNNKSVGFRPQKYTFKREQKDFIVWMKRENSLDVRNQLIFQIMIT